MTSTRATRPPTFQSTRVERYETIVIGAGQAGLATGYHLSQRDADFAILDGAPRIGHSWRTRWDSLRLFTPARYSGLPGMPFPAPPAHLPDKDETADYLERYADRFDLPVRLHTPVLSLGHDGHRFILDATDRRLEADQVVVATGPFHEPLIPALHRTIDSSIVQLHSSRYRNPCDLPSGATLVVGAGNSGAQIALELSRTRKVWLAGRDTGHLPRRFLGRDVFDWIWPVLTRATADTRVGKRMLEGARRGGDSLIGIPEHQLVEAGIRRVGRVDDVRGGLPVCNGEVLEPSVIVWCTGFEPSYDWLHLPVLDAGGNPRHHRGVAVDVPGLYFTGLRFQHSISSSLIGGVGADAAYVAERVAQRQAMLEVAG